jgi:hypothetical protein
MGAVLDKVVTPNMIGIIWPQPDAGSVVEPEPALPWLILRDLQPLPSQIRSTRFLFTRQPTSRRRAVMRR